MPTTADAAPGGYLNTAEVSERYFGGVSTQTVLKYVANHGLPAHRAGRRYLFDPAEVDAWVRTHNAQAKSDDHRAVIRALVDAAPELTDEQADRIRTILAGGAA